VTSYAVLVSLKGYDAYNLQLSKFLYTCTCSMVHCIVQFVKSKLIQLKNVFFN
jgi:hypothetical protein